MASEEQTASKKAQRGMPVALSIAGSDSGGGAGIQADLNTFGALGVFGNTAITCITAQNPDGVSGVTALEPAMVALQIATVCRGFQVRAAKTGMLYSAEIIEAVAHTLAAERIPLLVVDPVMVATSGARLLREDAIGILKSLLIPRATIVTPNLPEAEILWGEQIDSLALLKRAAAELSDRFGVAFVVKGGHMTEAEGKDMVTDVLCAGGETRVFVSPRVPAAQTHGTGCTFSAALAALLARGNSIEKAAEEAQRFVMEALAHAPAVGKYRPLGWFRVG